MSYYRYTCDYSRTVRSLALVLLYTTLSLPLIGCTSQKQITNTDLSSGTLDAGSVIQNNIKDIRGQLAPLISAAQDKFQVPGISLALVQGEKVLWAEGFGYADHQKKIPASPKTLYRAGSLAKPLAAISVMQMEESGEIDIDQPLSAYLPGFFIRSRFDTTAEPITVRSVLDHHSGLPSDLSKGMWSYEPYTRVAVELREEYAAFPPNLIYSYSNVGYTLLGDMVEKVSGTTYPNYVEKHIFEPLEMHDSSIGPPLDVRQLAKGYRNGEEAAPFPMRDTPAQGLYTSALDLGKFAMMMLGRGSHDGRRVLKPETLEEMIEPQNQDIALDMGIINGLGWFLEKDTIPDGGWVVRHGGTTLLYSAELILLPEKGLGVAVLANASGSRGIVSRLAEEILTRTLRTVPEPLSARLFVDEIEKDQVDWKSAEMGGNYATDLGLISIRPKNAKLCACIVEETFDLIPYPNGWFGINRDAIASLPPSVRPLAQIRFQTRLIDGKEVVIAQNGDQETVLGEKIPPEPIPEAWRKRVGDYKLVNPDKEFPLEEPRLKINNGQLCMSYRMPMLSDSTIQVPLRPISDTEAIILGLGRTRGETLRAITADGEEQLRYSGYIGHKKDKLSFPNPF